MNPIKNRINTADRIPVLPYHPVRFADEARRESGLVDNVTPLIVRRDDANRHAFADILYEAVDYYSIAVTARGTTTQLSDGATCEAARGDVYVVPLGSRYASVGAKNYVAYTTLFTMDIFDAVTLSLLRQMNAFQAFFLTSAGRTPGIQGGRLFHLGPDEFDRIETIFERMLASYNLGSSDGRIMTRIAFYELLVTLVRMYANLSDGRSIAPEIESHSSSTITAAVRYLEENFADDVQIRAVASSCFLSPDAFGKQFLEHVGQTPRGYLTYLRIEHAKRLLATTDETVANVGWRCGYLDAAYFIRAFRLATGTTPGKFRQQALSLT